METLEIASVGEGAAPVPQTEAPVVATPPPASPLEPKDSDYFSRMQEAVLAADSSAGMSAEDEAAQVISEVTDAPVQGDNELREAEGVQQDQDTGQQTPGTDGTQTGVEDAKPKPVINYDQLPENMRAELRRANLAPEVKEALAQSWYERKAYHDVGFTVEQARALKQVGVTPEIVEDRLRVHPTLDDAVEDSRLANLARTLVNDFQSNPSSMLDGLSMHAPEAFPQFAEAVANRLQQAAPDVYRRLASRAMYRALEVLGSEVDENDYETKEKVEFVRNRLFPQQAEQGQKPGAFNPEDPIHRRYAELQEQQQRAYQTQAVQFTSAAEQYGTQAVMAEVGRRVSEALPKGASDQVRQRAAGEIMARVQQDFFGNRGIVESINRMVAQSDLSQESLNQIVQHAYSRAVPLIAVHSKPVLEFWSQSVKVPDQPPQPAVKAQSVQQASSRTVANAPSSAKVAGTAPTPNAPQAPPASFIADGRKKGWDTGKIIGEWLSGRR
jgi:hypothetical protein